MIVINLFWFHPIQFLDLMVQFDLVHLIFWSICFDSIQIDPSIWLFNRWISIQSLYWSGSIWSLDFIIVLNLNRSLISRMRSIPETRWIEPSKVCQFLKQWRMINPSNQTMDAWKDDWSLAGFEEWFIPWKTRQQKIHDDKNNLVLVRVQSSS